MAKLTTDEIIDALKEMTLLEASELVKAIEDTFGVSAAAPAAVVAAPAAGAAEAEEKTEFLTSCSRASATTRSRSSRPSVSSPTLA